MAKYHNKKTVIDGIPFDSKKEAQRYAELRLLERAGEITNLQLQPSFELYEGFRKNSKAYRPIHYLADFMYWDNKLKRTVVEDVKGVKTEVFRIKQKMFEAKYPDLTISII